MAGGLESEPRWLEMRMTGMGGAEHSFISVLFLLLRAWCRGVLQCVCAYRTNDSATRSLGESVLGREVGETGRD